MANFWELYPKDWDKIKASIKKRDNYTCKQCNKKYPANSKWLHVHHKISLSRGGSNDTSNLITLCYKCHKSHHPHMNKSRKKSRALKTKMTFNKPFSR